MRKRSAEAINRNDAFCLTLQKKTSVDGLSPAIMQQKARGKSTEKVQSGVAPISFIGGFRKKVQESISNLSTTKDFKFQHFAAMS